MMFRSRTVRGVRFTFSPPALRRALVVSAMVGIFAVCSGGCPAGTSTPSRDQIDAALDALGIFSDGTDQTTDRGEGGAPDPRGPEPEPTVPEGELDPDGVDPGGGVDPRGPCTPATATWGTPASGNYSGISNWITSPLTNEVPLNNPQFCYSVVIPTGKTVTYEVAQPVGEVDYFELASGSTFIINPGRSYTVLDEARIGGLINVQGGTFIAQTNFAQFSSSAARMWVSGGGISSFAARAYSATGLASTQTLFYATGLGTVLDLSSLQSINDAWNDGWDGTQVHTIQADNGALLDLSSVQSITSPARGEDRLDIVIRSGGQIDLSSLATLGGGGSTRFDIADADLTLPSLSIVDDASFVLGNNVTINLPALISDVNTDYTIPANATINAENLVSLQWASLSLADGAAFNAPNLVDISGSVVDVNPLRTFISGPLEAIDNARLRIRDGLEWGATEVTDPAYSATGLGGSQTLFYATGLGTVLDLSSLQSINDAWNDGWDGTQVHTIQADNGALLDLSSVQSITSPARGEDRLDIVSEELSTLDLSSLETVTGGGRVRFAISAQASMLFGNLVVTPRMDVVMSDITSMLDITGSLILNTGGTLSNAAGGSIQVGGHFQNFYTAETSFRSDTGVVRFDGQVGLPVQTLEVAGTDSGAGDPGNNGNFGFGQMIIGTDTQATTVELLDVINNGNRGGTGGPNEALYLFGLGGPNGLRILNGSVLIIHNLNVYTTENGQWVHINSLFPAGINEIPYDEGFIRIDP